MREPSHNEIAGLAYERFEARGRQHGRDLDDWFDAEREVRASTEPWTVEAPQASLTADVDTGTLVLRLGIAVNALRAAQRFFYAVRDAAGSGGERDRLWAFLIALGFLHEAIRVLRPNFPKVRELAIAGGADAELITAAGTLLSGRLALNETLARMRNRLIFHWDDAPIREFVTRYTKATVVWADGVADTQGEMLYRAAADALTNSVLPNEPSPTQPESPGRGAERLKTFIAEVVPATERVMKLFDFAIKGHVIATGAEGTCG